MNSFYVNLFVTDFCNYKCRYCYEQSNTIKNSLSQKNTDNVINFIKNNIKEDQTLILNFHGGEPLLKFDLIKYIINKVKCDIPNESMFGMTTNGSLLTDDKIDFLLKEMTYDLSISLDGNEQTQNKNRIQVDDIISFDKLIGYAKKIQVQNNNLRIRMTYDKYNIPEIFNNIKYFVDNGFKTIVSEADFFSTEWENKDFEDIYEQFLKVRNYLKDSNISDVNIHPINDDFVCLSKCSAGHDYYTISSTGNIYPCTLVVNNPSLCMGDVLTGVKQVARDFIDKINSKEIDSCSTCTHNKFCMSSRCLLINYASTGSYYSPNLIMCNLMNVKHRLSKS